MSWLLGLIGLFIGAFLGGAIFRDDIVWMSAVVGAIIGVLFGRTVALRQKLADLENRFDTLSQALSRREVEPRAVRERAPEPVRTAPVPPRTEAPPVAPVASEPMAAEPAAAEPVAFDPVPFDIEPPPLPPRNRAVFDLGEAPSPSSVLRRETPPQTPRVTRPAAPAVPDEPDLVERAIDAVKRWFTEGNVPVKIGVLLLFLGVGALLKYAADQGWLRVPMEFRLAGIAAGAIALLVFAWRKREVNRAFSLSLQGGAIGILILDVFGAYKLYNLIPGGAAFALLVVLVAGAGVLAVAQDALALALLGIVGGFLAPILTSTDSGNHVALFTYYAVLNTAIFGIAWVKPWRALNLVGFAFTFLIGTAWGTLKYRPELFSTTEPFLILFYAFYLAIPVLYAWRQPDDRRGFVDGSLVFGTPLLAFPLQAALLSGDRYQLAVSAVVLAAAHLGVAWFALRRLSFQLLGHSHALLALGFATLAVPLALSARATACAWAVEGAALVWLGLRQERRLPRWIGYGLQLAAGGSLLLSGIGMRQEMPGDLAILNGDFLAIALVAAAGFISALLVRRAAPESQSSRLLLLWTLVWWMVLGLNEIWRFAPEGTQANWLLGFAALTTWLAAELRRWLDWEDIAWPAYAGIIIAPLAIIATDNTNGGPLTGWGLAAWLGWFVASYRTQFNLRACDAPVLGILHFVHTWTWVLLLCAQIHHTMAQHDIATIWTVLATLVPAAFAFWGTIVRFGPMRIPLVEAAESVRPGLLGALVLLLGVVWFAGLFAEGDPRPLAYLPVLNPLELAQIAFVIALLGWFRRAEAEGEAFFETKVRAQALTLVAFALLTSMTLRGVHFLAGVPWSGEIFDSALAQACLSVVWCLAGLAAMLVGAGRGSRPIWIGGATLVGVVIAKLIVVDRNHLSDLSAILGVLAVGGLLLVVGWFAPNPPKRAEAE